MAQPTAGRRQFGRDIARTRRLLKRLPDTVEGQMLRVLQDEAPYVQAFGKAVVPVKTGRLRAALRYRINPKALRLEFGLIGRRLQRSLFYGWILEKGRKAGLSRRWAQRKLKGGGYGKKYKVNVRGIAEDRYDFVFGRAREYARGRIVPKLKRIWELALREVAGIN